MHFQKCKTVQAYDKGLGNELCPSPGVASAEGLNLCWLCGLLRSLGGGLVNRGFLELSSVYHIAKDKLLAN